MDIAWFMTDNLHDINSFQWPIWLNHALRVWPKMLRVWRLWKCLPNYCPMPVCEWNKYYLAFLCILPYYYLGLWPSLTTFWHYLQFYIFNHKNSKPTIEMDMFYRILQAISAENFHFCYSLIQILPLNLQAFIFMK
jgi:hypothetical protein